MQVILLPWMLQRLFTRVPLRRLLLHQVADEIFGCKPKNKTTAAVASTAPVWRIAVFTGGTWVWNVIPVRRVKFILCFQDLLKQLGVVFIVKRRVSAQPERKRWDIFNTRKRLLRASLGPEPLTGCKKWLLSTSSPLLCCMASAREPRELRDTHKQGEWKSNDTKQHLP